MPLNVANFRMADHTGATREQCQRAGQRANFVVKSIVGLGKANATQFFRSRFPQAGARRWSAVPIRANFVKNLNLSVGFIAGAPVTNAFETRNARVPETIESYSQAKDYVVGLTLEYRLLGNFSLEGDALYRELHLEVGLAGSNRANSVSPSPVVTWELPLMAKYELHWWKTDSFVKRDPHSGPPAI
jgi:hypothetical protein